MTQIHSEVRSWAAIVRRIWNYPGANRDTPVSAVWKNGKLEHVTSKEVVTALRMAVVAVGEEKLGFKAHEISTHSIRSMPSLCYYDDRSLVERRLFALHQETGGTIQSQRLPSYDSVRNLSPCPGLRTKNIISRPQTTEPCRQRRDKEECWW